MKQYSCVAVAMHMFKLAVTAFASGSFVNYAYAAPCDFKSNPSRFIPHKLAASQLVPHTIGGNQTGAAAPHTGMIGLQHG